jgi:hypothetical protein
MRVVCSPLHLGHEISLQTVLGVQVPVNDIQEGGYPPPTLGGNARACRRGAEGRVYDPMTALGSGPTGSRA